MLGRREEAVKDERAENKKETRKEKEGEKKSGGWGGADMKEEAEGGDTNKSSDRQKLTSQVTANGTAYIKQIEIVYTGRDGKKNESERFVACGVKGME